MSASIYGNVGGVSRKAKELYGNVGGVTRKLKSAYANVGGVTRKIYSGYQCKAYTSFIGGKSISNVDLSINADGSGHFSAKKYNDDSSSGTFRFYFLFDDLLKIYEDNELFQLTYPTVSNAYSNFEKTQIYDVTSGAYDSTQYCIGSDRAFIQNRIFVHPAGNGRSIGAIRVDISIGFEYSRSYVASYRCSWLSGDLKLFGEPITSVELI